MLDYYLRGGFLMHPILLSSIIALAIAIERFWYFWRMRAAVPETFQAIKEDISKGDIDKARERAEEIPGAVGTVLREGLSHPDEEPEIIQEIMAIRGEELLREANRGIPTLALIPSVSTMLGLLGTVIGLVEAFSKVAEMEERVSPAILSHGIWTALITTVGGLFVAIPTLITHHYFQGKVAHLAFQLEHHGSEILLLIKKNRLLRRPHEVM